MTNEPIPNALYISDLNSVARDGVIIAENTVSTIFVENIQVAGNNGIVLNDDNTVVMRNCSFELAEGGNVVLNNTGVYQQICIFSGTVTVNGVVIDETNYAPYFSDCMVYFY